MVPITKAPLRRLSAGQRAVAATALLTIAGVLLGAAPAPVEIDPLSRECIACHDGTEAPEVQVTLRNAPTDRGSHVDSFTRDHPIGMIYQNYVALNHGYKPILPQDGNMLFVNGAVGCLSCHDPLNPEPGHLVKSDRKSELCTTCHNK